MEPTQKLETKYRSGFSGFVKTLISDARIFLKIVAPIMLLASFITVLTGWLELHSSQNVVEPIRVILDVPLMLFGVVAIINVMVFKEASSSTFLAVFFIGTVIVGPELAEKALRAVTSGTSAIYKDGAGGLGYVPYSSGGISADVKDGANSKIKP